LAADYEIYLSFNNQTEGFRIPVNPESIEVKEEGQGKTYNIVGKGGGTEETRAGEINVIKSPKLREVSFSSLFPAQYYPFVAEDTPLYTPMYYINFIRKWIESKHPIRFIFAGNYAALARSNNVKEITDLNFPASIESFEWKEVAGAPGDIEYTIHLKEYVFYAARQMVVMTNAAGEKVLVQKPPARPDERIRPETYTLRFRNGYNLSRALNSVAVRFFDQNTERMRDIQKFNGISDADLKRIDYDGMVIKLPPK
jgi:hypothetical protein